MNSKGKAVCCSAAQWNEADGHPAAAHEEQSADNNSDCQIAVRSANE